MQGWRQGAKRFISSGHSHPIPTLGSRCRPADRMGAFVWVVSQRLREGLRNQHKGQDLEARAKQEGAGRAAVSPMSLPATRLGRCCPGREPQHLPLAGTGPIVPAAIKGTACPSASSNKLSFLLPSAIFFSFFFFSFSFF